MKNRSVKWKITVWMTLLVILLELLLMGAMLSVSSAIIQQTAMTQLTQHMKSNVQKLSLKDGKLDVKEGFYFYQNHIYTLIYSKGGALLAGQAPVLYTEKEEFENGIIRRIDGGEEQYLMLDLYVNAGWEDGIWVRGIMEVPHNQWVKENIFRTALVMLPAFIFLAALGSYWILKRAFRPLENMIETAEMINEAKDLSRRIALPQGSNEFSRLAAAFDRLFERLEISFEAEKQFTADASHELRTPLAIIKSACEYGQAYDETPQERMETLSMIHRQAIKMTELTEQLLTMARLDQGIKEVSMECVEVKSLITNLCEEYAYDMDRLKLVFCGEVSVRGDAALLMRLIRNLLDNAFKYGKEDGYVGLTVKRQDHEVWIQVADEGIGIEKAHQEKIWKRFYRVDTSRSGDKSAGLGLAMVRQIAELHHGYMTLQSEPGEGSVFTLHLPEEA